MRTPVINIGILTDKTITFLFNEEYINTEDGSYLTGEQRASFVNNKIHYNGKLYDELFFEPSFPAATFELKAVTIGVDFHWQRNEDQLFKGALNLVIDNESIVAINQVNIEDYLVSVISSEMNATSSKEFLKAHAIVSRSWLIAQISKSKVLSKSDKKYQNCFESKNELIRWYDREDHALFDVCADDHCQRYQGITRASNPIVEEAVNETRGEVLTEGHGVVDARFSKCCGGVSESFATCWEPVHHASLEPIRDFMTDDYPNLTVEAQADEWIRTSPDSYCNTSDKEIISQVLNNYDQETTNFYRWKVVYTQDQIAGLLKRKSGKDFGEILDLIPIKRGASARLEKLKIVGTKLTYTVGKELEIRRILSETHLFSSAFVVDKEGVKDGVPERFVFTGAGWGHGVGLCQIGAAIMGAKGYDYKQILAHYYRKAFITKRH